MADFLEKMQSYALNLSIKKFDGGGLGAVDLNTVSKVLNDINRSYQNYLKAVISNDDRFASLENKEYEKGLLEDLKLYLVNSKIGSLEASLAPNLEQVQQSLFKDEVFEWKKESFYYYRDEIIQGNFEDINYINDIREKFTADQSRSIFDPLFKAVSNENSYRLNVLGDGGKIMRTILQPPKQYKKLLTPKKDQDIIPEEKLIKAYVKVKTGEQGEVKLTQRYIKNILDIEELDYETYPFVVEALSFEGITFLLSHKIKADVQYEEDQYFITYDPLNITVWGDDRDEAENAFAFQFYALYQNYFLADDNELTRQAITLKEELKQLIKQIVRDESTQA